MPLPSITLPDGMTFLEAGHAVDESDVFANSARGTGHRRKRRLYTEPERKVAVSLALTEAQTATFHDWFENTLTVGALPFAAEVANDEGEGLLFWTAYFEKGSLQYEPMPSGMFRVTAALLLTGEGAASLTVAPPPPGDPVWEDTFTAADSTDPTTRDVDFHPAVAGLSRWQQDGSTSPGVITSNRLAPVYLTDISDRALIFAFGDASEIFVSAFPYFMLMVANPGTGATSDETVRFLFFSDSASTAEVDLVGGGGFTGGATSEVDSWFSAAPVALGAGTHKVGVFVAADGVTLVADGAVVDSSGVLDMGSVVPVNFLRCDMSGLANAGPFANEGVDLVAMYQGITLEQALVLTT
jgi:hypothetical protein